MKENKYDDEIFYNKYASFPRSVKGLEAAGEWQELKEMLPDFKDKRVLDLGCGFGWHCRYAAQNGAVKVTGVDISKKMLKTAKEKTDLPNIEYLNAAIEDIDFPPESFDAVISSLALHYIESKAYTALTKKVYNMLTTGGDFVFSAEHPVFTAPEPQGWHYENGKKLHWPVDNYFTERRRETVFLGESIIKYHRTLAAYVGGLLNAGFTVTGLSEPQPDKEMLRENPAMADELRRPMMLILSAKKL